MTIAKTSYPIKGAKIMVKRPIFLHQHHNILNIHDRAMHIIGRNTEGFGD